jgi:hypothetical protein
LQIVHGGKDVPLDHMHAELSIECPCEEIGRAILIRVHFTHHCYTEAFDPAIHTEDQIVCYDAPPDGRPRVFCPIRHKMSLDLPNLIKDLPGHKVHQSTSRRNYVFVVPLKISNQLYEIYFMLQRAEPAEKSDLRLTVESAYPVEAASPVPKRPGKIRFQLLAYKTLRKERIWFAPR